MGGLLASVFVVLFGGSGFVGVGALFLWSSGALGLARAWVSRFATVCYNVFYTWVGGRRAT